MIKSRPKTIIHNGVKGRSLNHTEEDKNEFLKRRRDFFLKHGIIVSGPEIIKSDFKMSMAQFCETNVFYDRIRFYLYKKRGSYSNNKRIA